MDVSFASGLGPFDASLGMEAPQPSPPMSNSYDLFLPFYLSLGCLSLLAALVVTVVFQQSPQIHRDHASTLILIITVCDILFTLKYLVSGFAYLAGETDQTRSFHFIKDRCITAEIWGQFFSMASISWNACWILDFLCVLRDPLRNTASQMRWYHLYVWSISLATTLYVAFDSRDNIEGESCWIVGDTTIGMVFNAPLYVYMGFGVLSIIYASVRLSTGSDGTRKLRRAVFMRHAIYVIAFIALWLWPVVHAKVDPNDNDYVLTLLNVIVVSGQALIFAIIRLSQPGAWSLLTQICSKAATAMAVKLHDRCPCIVSRFGEHAWNYAIAFMCCCGCKCNLHDMGFGTPRRGLYDGYSGLEHKALLGNMYLQPNGNKQSPFGEEPFRRLSISSSHASDLSRRAEEMHSVTHEISRSSSSTYHNPVLAEHHRVRGQKDVLLTPSRITISASAYALTQNKSWTFAPPSDVSRSAIAMSTEDSSSSTFTAAISKSISRLISAGSDNSRRAISGGEASNSTPLLSDMGDSVTPTHSEHVRIAVPSPISLPSYPMDAQGLAPPMATPRGTDTPTSGFDGCDSLGELPEFAKLPAPDSAIDAFGNREYDIHDLLRADQRSPPEAMNSGSNAPPSLSRAPSSDALKSGSGWDALQALRLEEALCMLSGLCQAALSCDAKQRVNTLQLQMDYPAEGSLKDINTLIADPSTIVTEVPLMTEIDCDDFIQEEIQHELQVQAQAISTLPNFGHFSKVCRRADVRTSRFELVSFADRAFAEIRGAASLRASHIAYSLDPFMLKTGELSAHFSEGASSSFFCRSVDQLLVVKTVGESEVKMLLRLLPAYRAHLATYPSSLLCRFYGCYGLKLQSSSRVFFILMGNAFPIVEPGPSSQTFDLKGSTIGRRARVSKSINSKTKDGKTVSKGLLYQDMEFRDMYPFGLPTCEINALVPQPTGASTLRPTDGLLLGSRRAREIVNQLRADAELLASHGLMDYSLLINLMPITEEETDTGIGEEKTTLSDARSTDALKAQANLPSGEVAANFAVTYRLSYNKAMDLGISECVSLYNAACTLPTEIAAYAFSTGRMSSVSRVTRWSPLAVSVCLAGEPDDALKAKQAKAKHGSSHNNTGDLGTWQLAHKESCVYARKALVQIGVIDMLQSYDVGKRMENTIKSLRYATASADISSVNPELYAARFNKFVERIFMPASMLSRPVEGPMGAQICVHPTES